MTGRGLKRMHSNVLLNSEAVAEFLGVSPETLAQWRSQHRGPPYVKVENRLVRYRLSDLEEYISGSLVEHPPVRNFCKS